MTSDRSDGSTRGERLRLRSGDAALTIDPAAGARFASLLIGGHELLVTDAADTMDWGCYPMAPFAGRIREGRFTFRGGSYQLARNLPPHAIHGTVLDRRWEVVDATDHRATLAIDLGPGWPFRGRIRQRIELGPAGLDATLTLEAEEPMPAWIGWHPWFRRRLASGGEIRLVVDGGRMYHRGTDGLPTGGLVDPSPEPWDDAFSGFDRPPSLTWPGALRLDIVSSAAVWVVFNERPNAICVEPQTAPPDAIGLAERAGVDPPMAEPGKPLNLEMRWRWTAVEGPG